MSDRPNTVDVLLPYALAGCYSYSVPPHIEVAAGDFVHVPLGTRHTVGVVWGDRPQPAADLKLRPIAARIELPPLPELTRRVIEWIAAYYLEPVGNILRLCLRVPGVFDARRETIGYVAGPVEPERLTPQRTRVLEVARQGVPLRASELAAEAAVGVGVVHGLARQGALRGVALSPFLPFAAPDPLGHRVALNPEQAGAAEQLRQAVAARSFSVTLIDGVTGSGKTEVYFEAMAAALSQGRQVLLLLPEIALTQSFLERVEQRFRAQPAEWHSGVRQRERERVWLGVASGAAKVVVGARSALFLPWRNLGLIVVDEEHEPAFKQEDGVRYHARDMAVVLGSLGRFPVVLASATPSLESLVNAGRQRYRHVILRHRHGVRKEIPSVELIDLRTAAPEPGRWLSPALVGAMQEAIAKGEQVLLFLNRRGYAPLTLCRACGHRIECPNCSAWLVEHRFKRQLLCHHCGHQQATATRCPACEAEGLLVPCGPGIERLAEEAAGLFPEAAMTLLSSDLNRGSLLKDALSDAARGRYNLLIGTQLVAKGHHFPGLTLVGVVDGDLALETIDPRAGERTWQILAQVAGRAGRGERPGRALVQTHLPGHPLMQALAAGDRDRFLSHERRVREAALLPPFGRLAGIIGSARDAGEVERFMRALARRVPVSREVTVLGPAPAPMALVQGRHRWRFLVRAGREVNLQSFLSDWLKGVEPRGSLKLEVDVDPYSFL
ncbi:MAG TPA: primosomal protein N' [Aestuariivirgaceae bacterium]|jgi:primosomal protein N' (replication factor Y)|nr:primosomal protein N' [Aestuariivirgaceae bacterium]